MEDNRENKAEYGKVVFNTDDGEEEFYVLEQTMLGGLNYILVTDDPEDEEGSFLILREDGSEEDIVSYEPLEDENELRAVLAVFNELLEDIDLEV